MQPQPRQKHFSKVLARNIKKLLTDVLSLWHKKFIFLVSLSNRST